jgi:hypothetical protein
MSATLLVGLCRCSLLFDLGALDEQAVENADGDDVGNGDDGGNVLTSPDAGDDGPADDVGTSVVDATSEGEASAETAEASSADVADSAAISSTDATDARAGGVDARGGVDAAGDVARDAPPDVPPPFDASSCPSVLLTPSPINVMASTTRTLNYANQAIDNNFTTRWESMQQADEPNGVALPPQWIYLDFGASVYVTRVRIDWQDACAQTYELQVSDNAADAATWVTTTNGAVINSTMSGTLGAPTDWTTAVDTTGISGLGRYLRVYMTQRCQPLYGYSIWEMQVYGHGVSGCAQGK